MIRRELAQKLMLRFGGLQNFPKQREARDELVRLLAEYADSEAHAERAIRGWMETSAFCPTPFDLRERLLEARRKGPCPECGGSGWIADDSGFSRRCACAGSGAKAIPRLTAPARSSGEHPEVAIGIPRMVVTAQQACKRKYADWCRYDGPLTLAEAVEKNYLTYEQALRHIVEWEDETGAHFPDTSRPQPPSKPPVVQFPAASEEVS